MFDKLEIFDKRLIVLYILNTANKPLTSEQIASFCSEFEDITYIDMCYYIHDLSINGYIDKYYEDKLLLYKLTDSGYIILKELLELVPGINIYKLKKILSKTITDVKKEYSVDTSITLVRNDEYKVSCCIKDGNDELINITMYADNVESVKKISTNWKENSQEIYTKIIEMMTK